MKGHGLMVQYSQVSRHDLVLQHRSVRDVDLVSVAGDDDHRPFERDVLSERHVARYRQVIQFENFRNRGETVQKLADLERTRGTCPSPEKSTRTRLERTFLKC